MKKDSYLYIYTPIRSKYDLMVVKKDSYSIKSLPQAHIYRTVQTTKSSKTLASPSIPLPTPHPTIVGNYNYPRHLNTRHNHGNCTYTQSKRNVNAAQYHYISIYLYNNYNFGAIPRSRAYLYPTPLSSKNFSTS